MPIRRILLALALTTSPVPVRAEDPASSPTMDEMRFRPPGEKGTADWSRGRSAGAIRFHFDKDARSASSRATSAATPEWDRPPGSRSGSRATAPTASAGCSSSTTTTTPSATTSPSPSRGRSGRRSTSPGSDLIPVLPGPKGEAARDAGGNRAVEAHAASGSASGGTGATTRPDLRPRRDPPGADDRPRTRRIPARRPARSARVLAKLKAGKPITVVTMGDSLTDKRHWANREVAWVDLLKDRAEGEVRVGRHDGQPGDRRDAAPAEPRADPAMAGDRRPSRTS